jgi:hypothetical protein
MMRAVAAHVGNGIVCELKSVFEFNRNPQSVADRGSPEATEDAVA